MKGIEKGLCQFVVAGGDGAVDFEVTDHALNAVALAVDTAVPADGGFAAGLGRNDVADTVGLELEADRIGVVALVGDQMAGPSVGERGYGLERRAVRRFAAGKVEGERSAPGITETVNLTGEPAPRAAKSLFASPPFAPAAETWPRIVVESTLWRALSAIAWANVEATTSQTPAWLQRRKRWYTVIHLPYFSGTSRQGAPVRMRHRIPFTTVRLSNEGRFLRPRSAGSRSFSRRHSASLRSPRLTDSSSPRGILESSSESLVNSFVNSA